MGQRGLDWGLVGGNYEIIYVLFDITQTASSYYR